MIRPLATALLIAWAGTAHAADRYAIVIGSNQGDPAEAHLLFAERDAQRVGEVLTRLGGVEPEHLVTLLAPSVEGLTRALHALRDDIVAANGRGEQPVFVIYYSGHADGTALHLGGSRFDFALLRAMVADARADVSLFIVDACRSGGLVRAKGAHRDQAFNIRVDDKLASTGIAIITSSAEGEDAQESERLGGGIFTHHLVTGLLGAADASGDERVTLSEAYRYAYAQTLSATTDAPTLQHPTYSFQLDGQRELVLTELQSASGLGRLRFLAGGHYVVLEQFDNREVAAELDARVGTDLVLKPGTYVVRRRDERAVFESGVAVISGRITTLHDDDLQQIAYRHAARKGYGQASRRVFSVGADAELDGPTLPATGLVWGAAITGQLDLAAVALRLRVRFGRSRADNGHIVSHQTLVGADLGIYSLFDVGRHGIGFGLRGGFDVIAQTFDTVGDAPDRRVVVGRVGPVVRFELALGSSVALQLDGGVEVYLLEAAAEGGGAARLTPRVVPFVAIGFGVEWP